MKPCHPSGAKMRFPPWTLQAPCSLPHLLMCLILCQIIGTTSASLLMPTPPFGNSSSLESCANWAVSPARLQPLALHSTSVQFCCLHYTNLTLFLCLSCPAYLGTRQRWFQKHNSPSGICLHCLKYYSIHWIRYFLVFCYLHSTCQHFM